VNSQERFDNWFATVEAPGCSSRQAGCFQLPELPNFPAALKRRDRLQQTSPLSRLHDIVPERPSGAGTDEMNLFLRPSII